MNDQAMPQMPDPNGPPQGMDRTERIVRRVGIAGLTIMVGGTAAFLVLAVAPTRTMGALRSERIKWQQRQETAEEQAQSMDEQTPGKTDAREESDGD